MLAHSPPFPLIIDYDVRIHGLSIEDEEGMMLALGHRDRVQCIFVWLHVPSLQKLITLMDNELPALEYLRVGPPTKHNTCLTLPLTFEAPYLRYLELTHFAPQIGSLLISTATGIVRLFLHWVYSSTYPHPNNFLQQLSLLPQLEEIIISFCTPVSVRDIERQLLHSPDIIHVILPNLRLFDFMGVSAFLEAILPYMAIPLLEDFRVRFSNQLQISAPHLQHFMMTTEKPRFSRISFIFHHKAVVLLASIPVGAELSHFEVTVSCRHLDWQVSLAAQISNLLRPSFSEVVDLILDYRGHTLSSEWHNQVDRTCWRELLGSFEKVKTLYVHDGLVGDVSSSLISNGEPPLEVLPKLEELICPTGSVDDKTFAPFIHEREVAGQPVDLTGETFPVGRNRYVFVSSTGETYIEPEPDPQPYAQLSRPTLPAKPRACPPSLPHYAAHPRHPPPRVNSKINTIEELRS
jgi:hypothetical protein